MRGFTLIEMMVALILSVIILAGVISVYMSVKQQYQYQHSLAIIQTNGRFSLGFLTRQIRMAGNQRCINPTTEKPASNALVGFSSRLRPSFVSMSAMIVSDGLVIDSCQTVDDHEQFIKTAFYIAKTSHRNKQGQWVNGLYMQMQGHRRIELVSGVNDLQLRYGIRGEQGIVSYVKASQVMNWADVLSVFIKIQLSAGLLHKQQFAYASIYARR